MTGAGAGRGPGKGGQWALVFAELSPSKTLQPLDKHDLIPPQGSNMKGRNRPGVGPTHPISQTGKPSRCGGGQKEDKRALRLWSRDLNSCPSGSQSSEEGPRKTAEVRVDGGVRQAVEGVPAQPLRAVHSEELISCHI